MDPRSRPPAHGAYLAFAAFGVFWGTWGATLPAIRDAAGVSDAQLGTALLCVGAGALPAMLLTGIAVDRFGGRVVSLGAGLLACGGVAVATIATGFGALAGLLLFIGAASGLVDVGANAIAGAAQRGSGRPVLARAHGVFSASVVVGSIAAGASQALDLALVVPYLLVVAVAVVAASVIAGVAPPAERGPTRRRRALPLVPLVAVGAIGMLSFAVENAHQSWGAVFLSDRLSASDGVAAAAPAVFAAVSAAARFAIGAAQRLPAPAVLVGGGVAATVGTLVLARAPGVPVALAGLALAAAGTAVLFPTLLGASLRDVPDDVRGRATSAVSTTAYVGFLLGPVYVGLLSGADGLRTAMVGVALVAGLAAVLAWPVTRWAGPRIGAAG